MRKADPRCSEADRIEKNDFKIIAAVMRKNHFYHMHNLPEPKA